MKDGDAINPGMRVKIGKLGPTTGMLIHERHLKARRRGAIGTLGGWVPGHGGDVWWVTHDNPAGEIGCYVYDEFDRLEDLQSEGLYRRLRRWLNEKVAR